MKRIQLAVLGLAAASLPILLGACQAGGSASGPAANQSGSEPAARAAAGSDPIGAVGAKATANPCHTADLSASLGPKADLGGGQATIALVYTNKSGHPCTLDGFGGVDLHGPNDPVFGAVYSLPRSNMKPSPAHLAPGDSATTLITYLPGAGASGTAWVPTELVATPPNETTQLTVAWPAGVSVLRQDAATDPGTFIDPVSQG